jgi:hypothetical protein
MADILGFEVALPKLNIGGFLSNSWIYILIIGIIGFILIIAVALLLFLKTYNKKIVVFENISGQGYQPTLKTKARGIKLGSGGEEVLKTLAGGTFLTAYGKKMGRNSYWFAKGPDGYLYNVLLGDLDTKLKMLDIEPVDRDVRMFHVALDRLSHQTYDKQNFLQKYGIHILLFVFLICLVGGMMLIISQVAKATSSLAATADTNRAVLEALGGVLNKANNIQTQTQTGGSGLVPVV